MAIFAIGAYYDGDVSQEFINSEIAGPGWEEEVAPALHQLVKTIKVGDIVYIKSFSPGNPITVKAIGVVIDDQIIDNSKLVSIGRNVKWVTTDNFTIERQTEKNNVRLNTMYEEFHPNVQKIIIDKLFG